MRTLVALLLMTTVALGQQTYTLGPYTADQVDKILNTIKRGSWDEWNDIMQITVASVRAQNEAAARAAVDRAVAARQPPPAAPATSEEK
jgi:hypothetical protein